MQAQTTMRRRIAALVLATMMAASGAFAASAMFASSDANALVGNTSYSQSVEQ
jgi:hypothetical protein